MVFENQPLKTESFQRSIFKNHLFVPEKSHGFFSRKLFLDAKKIYLFSELRINLGHSFDVKNCDLLIYDVFSAFPTLYTSLLPPSKKSHGFFCTTLQIPKESR